jgi:hypothetical protein
MADLDASTEAAELDARGMTALAAGKARPVALRAITLAAGAALSLGALYAGGIPYAGYEVHYGRFGWGPFELAFLATTSSSARSRSRSAEPPSRSVAARASPPPSTGSAVSRPRVSAPWSWSRSPRWPS